MFIVKRLTPRAEKVFEDTESGSENRDDAIAQALNLASEDAKKYRARIRATLAYVGYIAFMVEGKGQRYLGYAVSTTEDEGNTMCRHIQKNCPICHKS